MKVCFYTLGCKVNQQESAAIAQIFKNAGYTVVGPDDIADIYVVNSCTVTRNGDKKSIGWIRKARKNNPEAVIVLRGCMPQAFPEKAEDITDADIVIGSKGKSEILNLVENFLKDGKRYVNIPERNDLDRFEELFADTDDFHTRGFLKIEDGCNRACAYCVIPRARGKVRSLSLEKIVKQAEGLAAAGHREIVLTGVNISCYGEDLGLNICDTVEAVAAVEGIERVRLSSLELDLFSDEMLVRLSRVKEFCPHFHLSLQSGCDKTLRNMKRLYDRSLYTDMMARIRELFDRPGFTTDIIVGFPGETEEDFLDSVNFVCSCGFIKVHCFPYSRRRGTVRADMRDQVPQAVKKQRNRVMIYKSGQKAREILESYEGFVDEALLEQKTRDGFYTGYTTRYIPVLVPRDGFMPGDVVRVRMGKMDEGRLRCTVI